MVALVALILLPNESVAKGNSSLMTSPSDVKIASCNMVALRACQRLIVIGRVSTLPGSSSRHEALARALR